MEKDLKDLLLNAAETLETLGFHIMCEGRNSDSTIMRKEYDELHRLAGHVAMKLRDATDEQPVE